jgi:hypothetical protein
MVLGNGSDPQQYRVLGEFFVADGQQGEGFDAPMDVNYSGAIGADDMPFFVREFDDWNPATGEYITMLNFSLIGPKDVLRNFSDENGNQAADDNEDWAPFLERHRPQYIKYALYDVPRQYLYAHNMNSPHQAQFSQVWLWNRANPFDVMGLAGQATGTGNGNISMWADMDGNNAIEHETAHLVGLNHTETTGLPGIPSGYNTVERRVIVGTALRSAIGSSATGPVENSFLEPLQYHFVFNFFRNQFGDTQARVASPSQTPVIYLGGMIGQDGEVTVSDSYRSSSLAPTPIAPAGNYWLRLMGASGVLADYRFDVQFEVGDLPEGEGQPTVTTFEVIQPWVNGTTSVEIWDSSHRLYQLPVSDSAPTVTVVSPNGGENVAADGTLIVQWSGSDADGDDLSYRVYYSPDGGTSWMPLAAATSATQLAVPAATLAGSNNALIEVQVSDGVNVGSDRSNAKFQVAGKGPLWATITAPVAGEQLVQSVRQTLVGDAYDLEDGPLTGDHLAWFSDQLGALGTGDGLTVTLPAGVHVLTLVATDSANLTVSSSITVEVLADFDMDGLADAYEEQYGELAWWNPDDAGEDPDGDGLTSRSEGAWGTDPGDADSDGDGVNDGDEAAAGSLPNDPNSKPKPARVMASAEELSFAMAAGGANPASVTLLLISSLPTTNIGWSASVNGAWLKVDVASGDTPAEVTVSVNGAGLPVGVHQGQITFQGGASPWTIPVTLRVADPSAPQMRLSLPTIRFQPNQ